MNNQPFLYFRGLRKSDHTVFVVSDGQKKYFDPVFRVNVPYSSGQQVKRQIIESLLRILNREPAPVTFYFDAPKLQEREVITPADPNYIDQLIGGWMVSLKGGETKTLKRRSPLSISALHPLHPLLSGLNNESITFDRSDRPHIHKVIVRNENGEILSEEEINKLLAGSDRSLSRKWIPDNTRATGLFVYDIAIDLRTLFCVSTNKLEPEITPATEENLRNQGWIETKNSFGKCLLAPETIRDQIINALAKALINWRITSNQSRTFSLMENIAIAISDNANKIAFSIRAELSDATDRPTAIPVIDETSGAYLFLTPLVSSIIPGFSGSADALDKAEQFLINYLNSFDYEKQEFIN